MSNFSDLQSSVPSLFATAPHESRSERYKFVSTKEYLDALDSRGWLVVNARQVNTRKSTPEHAKHFVTLRHKDHGAQRPDLGSVIPQISFVNSHNGTSRVAFLFGMFRMICSNGLMAATGEFMAQTFLHNRSAKEAADILITLNEEQTLDLAVAARNIRFGADSPVDPLSLNMARRPADNGNNLWLTFNRMQENITQGGVRFNGMRRMSRAVTNIAHDVNYNTELWAAAENLHLQLA
jgi:hypothetical protein